MANELLQEIGLSDKESATYLELLRHGTRSISFVAKKANLNRGTTYTILHQLAEKGLVKKTTKNKIMCFSALEPQYLLDYLERQKRTIDENKKKVSGILPQLEAMVNPLGTRPQIEYFEGVEGARTAYEDSLTAKEKTLRAYLSLHDVGEFMGSWFLDKVTKERIKRGYTLNTIRTLEKDQSAVAEKFSISAYPTNKKEKREVRFIKEELAFPATLYIYDEKILVISTKEEGFALIIESKELASMQRKLFDVMWNLSSKN